MDKTVRDDDTRVDIRHATSAGDFIPFTALPARYHGKVVALVIVGKAVPPAEDLQPFELS
jgi:hypothetical protein